MYKNDKYDSYNDFILIKKQNQSNCRNKFCSIKNYSASFVVIATKLVNIVFEKMIDNIDDFNKDYVTP